MVSIDFSSLIRSLGPQLKLIEELNFFKEDELQAVKNYRKFYGRTLSGASTSCEDILEYVRYELDLLAIIREKKVDDSLMKKKNTVTYSSGKFLNKMFSILTGHFPDELQLWFLYVKFCQGMKDTITLLAVIESLVKVHENKPCVFQLASRCSREDLRNIEKARDFILSGIRIHPESCEMYKEAFFLEWDLVKEKYAAMPEGDRSIKIEPLTKPILLVYEAARTKVRNVDFFLGLFDAVRGLPVAKDLETLIQKDLQELFPREEKMWDTLAKVKLEQLKEPDAKVREIITEVIGIYETALEKYLNTPKMWSMYIDRMLEIYNDTAVGMAKYKKNCVLLAFTAAYLKNQLTENHYLIWAELQKDEIRKLRLLKKGTQKLLTSVPLWTKMITTILAMNNEEDAWVEFKVAMANFKNDKSALLSLWKLMLRYYQCVQPDKVSWCFEQGVKSSSVSAYMKPMYLEWTTLSRGILAGRKLYNEISFSRPYSIALHEKMIELENFQVKPSIKTLRQAYALMTEHFGYNDVSAWMKWIYFENTVDKTQKNILRIKDRAMKLLQPALIDLFSSEMRFFEMNRLNSAKSKIDVLELNKAVLEVGGKRKASSTKNDRSKRKKLRA